MGLRVEAHIKNTDSYSQVTSTLDRLIYEDDLLDLDPNWSWTSLGSVSRCRRHFERTTLD